MVIKMKTKKLIALILSAALILSVAVFAGCGTNTRHIMTFNGEEIPAGIYIINQFYAVNEAQSRFAEEHPDVDMWAEDFKAEDYQIEGVDYIDWVNQRALELTARLLVIEDMFAQRDLSFTQEQLSEFHSDIDTSWNTDKQLEEMFAMFGEQALQFGGGGETWGQFFEAAGASRESFNRINMSNEKMSAIFADIYGVDGTDPVPEEEWRAFFKDEYVRFRIFAMPTVDEDGEPLPEDRLAELREFGQEQLAFIKDGGSFFAAMQAYHELNSGLGDNIFDLDFDDEFYEFDDDFDPDSDEDEAEDDDNSSEEADENEAEDDDNSSEEADEDEAGDDGDDSEEADEDEEEEWNLYAELDTELDEYIKISDFPENEVIVHLLSMDFDTPDILQTETNDYILMKLDTEGNLENENVFNEYRDIVTIDLRAEDFDDMLNRLAKELLDNDVDFNVNQAAIKRYSPRRFM
jgi:hypothetical protein